MNSKTLWGNTIMRSDTDRIRKEDEVTEDIVRHYCDERYMKNISSIEIKNVNGNTIVNIEGDYFLKEDAIEIPFKFGFVSNAFSCVYCKSLSSLKGCPDEVGEYFDCGHCKSLTSLEGCPKKVGGSFYCSDCGKQFTEREVRKYCDVKKTVYI